MIKNPPSLKKGDTIGLVCPSGFMEKKKTAQCIKTLESWGYKVKLGETVGGKSQNYFSGTDEERMMDFQIMLDDDDINADAQASPYMDHFIALADPDIGQSYF